MKLSKKLLALLLALLMLLPLGAIVANAEEDACPLIFVHGFMGTSIRADRNDPNSEKLWDPDMDAILNDVKDNLGEFLKALVIRDWDRFGDLALDIANKYIQPVYSGDDGEVHNDSGVYFRYPDRGSISKTSRLEFSYDWRLDPMQTAAALNDYINYVCDAAGTQQVDLHAHSFGAVITVTYLKLFGNTKVRGVFFDSPAVFGETFNGELMSGKLEVSVESMMDYMAYAFDDMEYSTLLNEVAKIARNIGLIPLLVHLGNEFIDHLQARIFKEVMVPMYANWPSVWSMIPDEYLDDATRFIFDELCAGEDRSALREKIDAYNTQIRPYRTETLQALNDSAHVYVLSRTGYASTPLTASHKTLSDGTIDTKNTSFGATTALYGEQLPADVLAAADPAMISPERDIDASTCLFPEQTWFLRYAHHGDMLDAVSDFAAFLLRQPQQVTVDTFAAYPRFLIYLPAAKEIKPDPGPAKQSWLEHMKALFAEVKLLLTAAFSKEA
ncbi:MAG: hypothetical protein IJL52_05570 [Clostridia bacterium]|nr:hypothetical protein [Clostridia bacterium]